MRTVIQRVSKAQVISHKQHSASIGKGLVILAGMGPDDTDDILMQMATKILQMRIFNDKHHKMNCSALDIKADVLVVSQFTLYADCRRGNRPGFSSAAAPDNARRLYERFLDHLAASGLTIRTGEFGSDMQVELINDGPVTIVLTSDDLQQSRRK